MNITKNINGNNNFEREKENLKNEIEKYKKDLEYTKKENERLKEENKILNLELSKVNKILSGIKNYKIDSKEIIKLREEIEYLKNQLYLKNKEVDDLNEKIKNNQKDKQKYYLEDLMVIYFRPTDYSFHQGIKCLASDTFAEVEEKLYKSFDELRNTNNMFTVRAMPILRFKKLSENNIQDGDEIQLFKIE